MAGMIPLKKEDIPGIMTAFTGRMEHRNRLIFAVMLYTGFRVSEVLSLNLGDVIAENGEICHSITVQRKNMKKKIKGRSVVVHPKLKEYLNNWLDILQQQYGGIHADVPLFCTAGLKRISRTRTWTILTGAYTRAGLNRLSHGCHGCRKTYGSQIYDHYLNLLQAGEKVDPIRATQTMMGHKSVDSTEKYLAEHIFNADDAVNSLDFEG